MAHILDPLVQFVQLLIDKLSAADLDIKTVASYLEDICRILEEEDPAKITIGTKHKLCIALATSYFLLLEHESDNYPETLSYIRTSLTCMSLLKQSSVASHILCRALLERCLVYGHLFNASFSPEPTELPERDLCSIRLSKENLKVTLGHRFRRLPNFTTARGTTKKRIALEDSSKPDKHSINSYLLIEAFKSSINSIDAFADLFVEFHCPVMFDKFTWPTDEALRVMNERNLNILKRFEQIPPFWDLYELIGQSGCLKKCLVLVKALLAAHLALWASATTNPSTDKMISTARLIPPLAQSNLVPKVFGYTIEVLPHLDSNKVFSVLSDIWNYLKETDMDKEMNEEEKKQRAKLCLNRLRLFMCESIPGNLYVKVFKDFYTQQEND